MKMKSSLSMARCQGSPALAGAVRTSSPFWQGRWTAAALLLGGLWAASGPALAAEFNVTIVGPGSSTQYPISPVPFRGEAAVPQRPSAIIGADLVRTGLFRTVAVEAGALDERSHPPQAVFRAAGSDYAVVGSVQAEGAGRYAMRFHLWDMARNQDMGGQNYQVPQADLRLASHRAADWIYGRITGRKGVAASRISYVTRSRGRYTLWVSDADGQNAQPALSSRASIISPSWSPDGSKIAYVSFELGKPVVYVQDVRNGSRHVVANFKGSNSAPAWSPDSSHLAVTLTRDGTSQIYLVPATGGTPRRITHSSAIDTEPVFSPDGKSIYFVSDRGGSPQIYRSSLDGEQVQRLTFQGSYNISPTVSADGKTLAFITNARGGYRVAVLDLGSGTMDVVSSTSNDEKPSFAPNSQLIIYATHTGGGEALMTTTADGSVKTRLSGHPGDIREPAWAPLTP